jgi:hypothetical protein
VAALAVADVWVTRIDGIVTEKSASDRAFVDRAHDPVEPGGDRGRIRVPVRRARGRRTVVRAIQGVPAFDLAGGASSQQTAGASSPGADIGQAAAEGCGAGIADGCGNTDSTDDGGDDADACSSADASSSDRATGRRGSTRGLSPVSRVVMLWLPRWP